MKRILLSLALIAGMSMTARAQQLPNVGFENWKGSGNAGSTYQSSTAGSGSTNAGLRQRPGDEPEGWMGSSINQKVINVEKQQEVLYKAGTNNNYYAKLQNSFVGVKLGLLTIGSNAPGYLTFGTPWVYAVSNISSCDGGTYGGISFGYKPDAIRGKYKKTSASKAENSYIIAYIWNGTFTSQIASTSTDDADRLKDDVDRAILGSVSGTGVTAPSRVTESGKLIAWCNYAFKNSTTTDSDWETIEVPLNYVADNISETPTKMNVVICAGDYWTRDNIQDGTTLEVDDVEFLYYSELSSAIYDGQEVEFDGTDAVLDKVYDENLLELYSNGHGAKIETEYDEDTGILVIYVMGEDYPGNSSNYNVYSIQFKKPEKPVQLGDVNKDNVITIADVTALVNVILGKDSENVYSRDAADVNGDKNITIADVTALVNLILGKTN